MAVFLTNKNVIQHGHMKLIKSDSKYIYNVTKNYVKLMLFF